MLSLDRPLAFDRSVVSRSTGRFVILDRTDISGGGVVVESLADDSAGVRDRVLLRNMKWIGGELNVSQRAERYGQRPAALVVTGPDISSRQSLARSLEAALFAEGRFTYFMGVGSLLYGMDADIKGHLGGNLEQSEHMRRLGELMHMFVDAGLILIVTASKVSAEDLRLLRTVVQSGPVLTVWVGTREDDGTHEPDLHVDMDADVSQAILRTKGMLYDRNIIFNPLA